MRSSCPGVDCHLVDMWGVAALCHLQLWLCLLLRPTSEWRLGGDSHHSFSFLPSHDPQEAQA